jgi:hypothetical protein
MARKPLSEKTVAENVLKWGTGAINIDGCRISKQMMPARETKRKRQIDQNGYRKYNNLVKLTMHLLELQTATASPTRQIPSQRNPRW